MSPTLSPRRTVRVAVIERATGTVLPLRTGLPTVTPVAQRQRPLALVQAIAGSSPAGSTLFREAAGYGLPGRFAKACDREVVRVQLPRFPLAAPVVKRTSRLASNEGVPGSNPGRGTPSSSSAASPGRPFSSESQALCTSCRSATGHASRSGRREPFGQQVIDATLEVGLLVHGSGPVVLAVHLEVQRPNAQLRRP